MTGNTIPTLEQIRGFHGNALGWNLFQGEVYAEIITSTIIVLESVMDLNNFQWELARAQLREDWQQQVQICIFVTGDTQRREILMSDSEYNSTV